MSYSFSITAATKTDATRKIREKFDALVAAQPAHAADKEAAIVVAQEFVRLLEEPAEVEEIYVSMNGSLGWRGGASDKFLSAQASVSASLRAKSK